MHVYMYMYSVRLIVHIFTHSLSVHWMSVLPITNWNIESREVSGYLLVI